MPVPAHTNVPLGVSQKLSINTGKLQTLYIGTEQNGSEPLD